MTAPTAGDLKDGVHVLPVRVYWEDTDAGGIVYYANYLKYAERARTDMLRLAGIDQSELQAEAGLTFAVRRCEVDYLRPARMDDALEVHSRFADVRGASLTADQVVRRGAEELARLVVRIACLDTQGRARRLPTDLRAALAAS